MVLYFPVSALVTLFGNILQNPLDPRARSDTRLLAMVVQFLSTLGQEVETGGVHRMLGICSEFERISKLMIERAEKENAGRRKRKNAEQSQGGSKSTIANNPTQSSRHPPKNSSNHSGGGSSSTATPRPTTASANTPTPRHHNNETLALTNAHHRDGSVGGYSPMAAPSPGEPTPAAAWSADLAAGGTNDPMEYASFAELTGFGQLNSQVPPPPLQSPPSAGGGMFQQPLIPRDLYSLPMSFDWDWAEMSGGAYPSVENGNFGEPR